MSKLRKQTLQREDADEAFEEICLMLGGSENDIHIVAQHPVSFADISRIFQDNFTQWYSDQTIDVLVGIAHEHEREYKVYIPSSNIRTYLPSWDQKQGIDVDTFIETTMQTMRERLIKIPIAASPRLRRAEFPVSEITDDTEDVFFSLNPTSDHWIAVRVNIPTGTIRVWNPSRGSKANVQKICTLLPLLAGLILTGNQPSKRLPDFHIHHMECVQQHNGNDCGPATVATLCRLIQDEALESVIPSIPLRLAQLHLLWRYISPSATNKNTLSYCTSPGKAAVRR